MTLGWDYAGISSAQHERSSDGVGKAFCSWQQWSPVAVNEHSRQDTVMWATQAGARAVANVSESAAATGVVCSASEDLSLTGSVQICGAFRSFCHARTLRCISSVHEHVPLYPPLTSLTSTPSGNHLHHSHHLHHLPAQSPSPHPLLK